MIIREQARDKYRNLSEEEKERREYEKNGYHNMSEEKKQRWKKKIKKIIARLKSLSVIMNKIFI